MTSSGPGRARDCLQPERGAATARLRTPPSGTPEPAALLRGRGSRGKGWVAGTRARPPGGEGPGTQSRLALCDPMDCNPAGSSVHGIVKAGILEWVAIQFFRGFFGEVEEPRSGLASVPSRLPFLPLDPVSAPSASLPSRPFPGATRKAP